MRIKFWVFRHCKNQELQAGAPPPPRSAATLPSLNFNLRDEYASAFRTESYTDFFARVLDLTLAHGAALRHHHSTPSFRLLAEHLLDPDQPTVFRLLSLPRRLRRSSTTSLLADFFSHTADASTLCSLLLKDLHLLLLSYRPLLSSPCLPPSSFTSLPQLHAIQSSSSTLLRRLELRLSNNQKKLRRMKVIKRSLAFFLIVLAAPASAFGAHLAAHALLAALVLPALPSARRLRGVVAQLDAAAKGTYILNRDLDTISRLVARVEDEVEHLMALLRLCGEEPEAERMAAEVTRQIRRNDEGFREQMDELEEHLYLCFMTINKTRSLVMKEMLLATVAKL